MAYSIPYTAILQFDRVIVPVERGLKQDVIMDGPGIHRLRGMLLGLPGLLIRRSIVKAMRAGGKLLQGEMQSAVPKRTGALRRAINIRVLKKPGKGRAGVAVGAGPKGFYAFFLEYGWRATGPTRRHGGYRVRKGQYGHGLPQFLDRNREIRVITHGEAAHFQTPKRYLTQATRRGGRWSMRLANEVLAREIEGIREAKELDVVAPAQIGPMSPQELPGQGVVIGGGY